MHQYVCCSVGSEINQTGSVPQPCTSVFALNRKYTYSSWSVCLHVYSDKRTQLLIFKFSNLKQYITRVELLLPSVLRHEHSQKASASIVLIQDDHITFKSASVLKTEQTNAYSQRQPVRGQKTVREHPRPS